MITRIGFRVWMLLAIVVHSSRAQVPIPEESSKPREFSEAIEDNSFYIEEAFNQEPGVVQHISTLTLFSSPQRDVVYSFTQEWPLFSQTHQLSVTIPYSFFDGNATSGLNDILLNYRYQLLDAEQWAAVSPRFSIVLPTGDKDKGLGSGVVGFQMNMPASKRVSNLVILHANAGATLLPRVEGQTLFGTTVRRNLWSFNLGGSIILLILPSVNVLLEGSVNFNSDMDNGNVVRATETVVNPALRFAIDVGSLQIVPGVGVPILFSEGNTYTGVFAYLSFEHPF